MELKSQYFVDIAFDGVPGNLPVTMAIVNRTESTEVCSN